MKNRALKPLDQSEFTMRIIEDLGIVKNKNGISKRKAIFECTSCDTPFETYTASAKRSKQKICMRCKNKNSRTTHGKSTTRLYRIWKAVENRCYKIKEDDRNYLLYKGDGVTMCNQWAEDFMSFYEWSISNGYSDNLELDKDILCKRKNINPKIYSPETCMWVTKSENNNAKFM